MSNLNNLNRIIAKNTKVYGDFLIEQKAFGDLKTKDPSNEESDAILQKHLRVEDAYGEKTITLENEDEEDNTDDNSYLDKDEESPKNKSKKGTKNKSVEYPNGLTGQPQVYSNLDNK